MGGLGKTTIARKLYNVNNTKFNCHAWLCVSQEWTTRDLLERILKSFQKLTKYELQKMDNEDMERYLHDLLKGHQYLVVIDDVWHIEAWESLKRALPDDKNGSRIIITTRIELVAEISDERAYVHKLRFLRSEESWELFSKKVFPDLNAAEDGKYLYPSGLQKLGEDMLKKCNGLPLAIIVLGGLLSRKQPHEWPAVKEHIWRELKNNSIHISSLLALSFKELPYQLKPCFLYLGLFPEDFVINAEKIIQLWVAEGFVPQAEEGLDMEEVGEEYLKELTGRSLIQVVNMNWRSIATCRVHDLLRDLAVSKARELNFLYTSEETANAPSTSVSSYRRLALHSGFQEYILHDCSNKHVRTTLLFFNRQDVYSTGRLPQIHARFRLLRVLDLEGFGFTLAHIILPDAVGKLIHWRYLGLKDTQINELPKSIGNLQALQTLDASFYDEIRLPREICNLRQLRHLRGLFSASPLLFEELTNLQSLKVLNVGETLRSEAADFALNPVAKLRKLKYLSVKSLMSSILSIQPIVHCLHLLELRIDGNIGNLPQEMHKFLPNLKYLELSRPRIRQDPFPTLEMFPNLIVLNLGMMKVRFMACTSEGFPQLEVFKYWSDILATILVEEGGMPRLRALSMSDRDKHFLPERLKSLPTVESLSWKW